jgi:Fur family ferric uptake transcriptional regulator
VSCGERLTSELRRAGYRVTAQRAVILESVAHAGDHRSAQQVYLAARRRLPGLNPATVYRTLETLSRAGLLDLHAGGGESLRFSIRDPHHPHAHLVCRACGRKVEVDPGLLGSLGRAVKRRTGFVVDTHHLTLGGLCAGCSPDRTRSKRGGSHAAAT